MNSNQNKEHETWTKHLFMMHKQKLFQEFRNKVLEIFKDKQLVILPTNFQKIDPNDRRSTADFYNSFYHGLSSHDAHKSTPSVYVHRTKRRESVEQRDQALVEPGSNSRELPTDCCDRALAYCYTFLGHVSEVPEKTLHTDLESRSPHHPD